MIAAVVVAVVAAAVIVVLAMVLVRTRRTAEVSRAQLDALQAELAATSGALESLRLARDGPAAIPEPTSEPATGAAIGPAVHDGSRPEPSGQATSVPDPEPTAAREDTHPHVPATTGQATTGRPGPEADAPTLSALWALTRIRQEWTSRQTAVLSLEAQPPDGRWSGSTLADVLDDEVSRIREDTGTPGTLRTSLPSEPAPEQSVLLITSLQALLEALSRHCQGYDLYVHEWERRLTAIVVCDGFDGPDQVAADASAVLAAIAPAGGDLALDRDGRGRLRARLSLAPAPPPAG